MMKNNNKNGVGGGTSLTMDGLLCGRNLFMRRMKMKMAL